MSELHLVGVKDVRPMNECANKIKNAFPAYLALA